MKSYLKILIIFLSISFWGCEEVVQIDLEESPPKLVVEASILWNKGTRGNEQTIRLTTTSPFFSEEIPPATGAQVNIIGEDGSVFNFEETEPGFYKTMHFVPEWNQQYKLEIIYEAEVFVATEKLVPVTTFELVEQSEDGGFSGEDIALKIYYRDPPGIENFYFFRFFHENLSIQISEDELTDGNLTFIYFSNENLVPGQEVGIEMQGISEHFYNYLYLLRTQSGNSGGPFSSQPTTVRGNIVNTTNPENFAFGFFRLSEIEFMSYTIQ